MFIFGWPGLTVLCRHASVMHCKVNGKNRVIVNLHELPRLNTVLFKFWPEILGCAIYDVVLTNYKFKMYTFTPDKCRALWNALFTFTMTVP